MATFNSTLPAGSVVVATCATFSDHFVAKQICVHVNDVDVWVSANCVDELVQCHEPIWA